MVRLHPDPPRNARAPRGGAIAQLGERLLCKQEVTGSIPVGSTSKRVRRGISNQCRAGGDVDWCFFKRRSRLFFNNLGLEGSCSFESDVVMTL